MSIVRDNIMNRKNYTPYCGNDNCKNMPRSFWNGNQFQCHYCGWESQFEEEFIQEYKEKWGKS